MLKETILISESQIILVAIFQPIVKKKITHIPIG